MSGGAQYDWLPANDREFQKRPCGRVRSEVDHDIRVRESGVDIVANVDRRGYPEAKFTRCRSDRLAHAPPGAVD